MTLLTDIIQSLVWPYFPNFHLVKLHRRFIHYVIETGPEAKARTREDKNVINSMTIRVDFRKRLGKAVHVEW